MNIQSELTWALFLGVFLAESNTATAVDSSGQYSRYQPQSFYSQSLSSYGNEKQNYFGNTGGSEGNHPQGYQGPEYSAVSYGSSDRADDGDDVQRSSYQQDQNRDSFQRQSSYHEYIGEDFAPFNELENSPSYDNYVRHYETPQPAKAVGTSSMVSFNDVDSHKTDTMNYQTPENVMYPTLRSAMQLQRPQNSQTVDYMTANNYAPSLSATRLSLSQSMPFIFRETGAKDDVVPFNAEAQMMVAIGRPPPTPMKTPQMNLNRELNEKLFTQRENTHQHQQDQQNTLRTFQRQPQSAPHLEFKFDDNTNNDVLSSGSSSRSHYIADGDLSATSSDHPSDAYSLSLLQKHPGASLQSLPIQADSQSSYSVLADEPIPISKHVKITKHVPVSFYRQIHVPYRKPVRIEIPRSVITTVPRPYPIHVPTITKTVAVPRTTEVKIPIEKVIPYPVEHRVPYVVEKRVPFQIEKQIPAPVHVPYPIKVPMIRTILHKKNAYLPLRYYNPRNYK